MMQSEIPVNVKLMTRRPAVALAGLYLSAVLVHIFLLREAALTPHISSDEVQYALTGDNIRSGKGYTLRGQFNASNPPLFPILVAAAHSMGPDLRASMLVIASLVMCSAIFPLYLLARYVEVQFLPALLLSAAAAMLPHTLYAGTYMAEILQYPLIITATYLAVRWMDGPRQNIDIALGCIIGCALLVKVQTAQFFAAFLISIAVVPALRFRHDPRQSVRLLAHGAMVLGIALAIQSAWWGFRSFHHGSLLGIYGTALYKGLPHWSLSLTLSYVADFLLAPGLLIAVPLALWFLENGNLNRTVLVSAILLIQIGWVSAVEGGLTGIVRERLFLYSLPIMSVLAVRGLDFLKGKWVKAALPALSILLVGLIALLPLYSNPAVEAPWAFFLGSAGLFGIHPFSIWALLTNGILFVVLISALVVFIPARATSFMSTFFLLFNAIVFETSSAVLSRLSVEHLHELRPILSLLRAGGGAPGHRLLIAGRFAYFESRAIQPAIPDDRFLDWTWHLGLGEPLGWEIETIGRYDVRMFSSAAALAAEARAGDLLLSAARFDQLQLLGFHFPVYVYRIPSKLAGAPEPHYETYIPAEKFYSITGRRAPSGTIVGTGGPQEGYLVYGPYISMTAGRYRAFFDVSSQDSMDVAAEVVGEGNRVVASERGPVPTLAPLQFATDGTGALQYRIVGRGGTDFRFNGVRLEFLGPGAIASSNSTALTGELNVSFVRQTGRNPHIRTQREGCYIDFLNEQPARGEYVVAKKRGMRVIGWAFDLQAGTTPEQLSLTLSSRSGETWVAPARRSARPDVVSLLHNSSLLRAGFSAAANTEPIPAGDYSMRILQRTQDSFVDCDPHRMIHLQ